MWYDKREDIVKNYFQLWLDKNIEPLGNVFLKILFIVSVSNHNITDYLRFENSILNVIITMRLVDLVEYLLLNLMKIVNIKEFQSKSKHMYHYE